MFDKNLSEEEKINLLGLENLDDIEKDAIKEMFNSIPLKSSFHNRRSTDSYGSYQSALAMYTQNFMIIRRLLEIKEQNQQIIELLTEIKNK